MGGCLLIAVAALLAFAVPASIAVSSLVGAYVVIALLGGAAAAAVVWNSQRPRTSASAPRPSKSFVRIGVLAVLYAVLVTVIHGVG